MANDALQRLLNSNNQEQSNYSLDEQLDSASDDDFLDGMSEASKAALFNAVEITLDDNTNNDINNDIENSTENTVDIVNIDSANTNNVDVTTTETEEVTDENI